MAAQGVKMSDEILLPGEGESVAIPLGKLKTAALCYDRIWYPYDEPVPRHSRCFGGSPVELAWVRCMSDPSVVYNELKSAVKGAKSLEEILVRVRDESEPVVAALVLGLARVRLGLGATSLSEVMNVLPSLGEKEIRDALLGEQDSILKGFIKKTEKEVIWPICRMIAKSFSAKHGAPMVPVYGSEQNRDSEYNEGDRTAIVAVLDNVRIVDEDRLTWEQVSEFRKDDEMRRKYRRFTHWLDGEMVGKSQGFVEDEISKRLEDYERALKKHGIRTVLGAIEETLDGTYLAGVSVVAGPLVLAGHPTLGMLAGAGLLVGRVSVKVVQMELDYEDVEQGANSEISWVYEAKHLGQ